MCSQHPLLILTTDFLLPHWVVIYHLITSLSLLLDGNTFKFLTLALAQDLSIVLIQYTLNDKRLSLLEEGGFEKGKILFCRHQGSSVSPVCLVFIGTFCLWELALYNDISL